MAVLQKFYLVYDQSHNCCAHYFHIMVERIAEFFDVPFPVVKEDANVGYILVDNHKPIDTCFATGLIPGWRVVEEKNFDESKLIKKEISGICDRCMRRRESLMRGELPRD